MQSRLFAVAVACAAAFPTLAQDPVPVPGHAAQLRHRDPSGPFSWHGCAVDLLGRDLFGAFEHRVLRIDEQGNWHELLVMPVGQRAGFVVRPRRALEVFFTHFEGRRLYRRHLLTQQQSSGPVPHQAFDLEIAPGGAVLVSANPTWPAPGNRCGIWLVDLAQGQHREIVQLAGPSGPLCFDAQGNLLFALQSATYPTPPGGVRVIRFAAADVGAAIAGTRTLTLADAQTVIAALDGAFDLEVDDRGRIYTSDPQHGDIRRTLPDAGPLDPVPFVARPAAPWLRSTTSLQFLDLSPATTFDAWQPAGGTLWCCSSDLAVSSSVHALQPQRPELFALPGTTLPKGNVRIGAKHAPPQASTLLLISTAAPVTEWTPFALGGAPLWLGIDAMAPLAWVAGATDARGDVAFDFVQPGGAALTVAAQLVSIDPVSLQSGTTPAVPLHLLR